LFLLYDFNDQSFFSGNKRKISLNLPFHLVDAVTTEDGLVYYVSNEKLSQTITIDQKLHKIYLSDYLGDYITSLTNNFVLNGSYEIEVYPNPSNDILFIRTNTLLKGKQYGLLDMSGKVVLKGELTEKETQINIENLDDGSYIFMVNNPGNFIAKKIIKN
jgi:hypothetical protein